MPRAVDDPRAAALIIAASTGMRRSEILGLQWRDIDWREETIQIRRGVIRLPDGQIVARDGKTRSARRTIHVSKRLLATLKRVRDS